MTQLIIVTNTGRNTKFFNTTDSLRDVINGEGIDITSANILLNGTTISHFDLDRTLGECGVQDMSEGNILSIVVKAAAAC